MIDAARIRSLVERNAPRFLRLLSEACAIPSISAEGGALKEMASWLEGSFARLGASVSMLEAPGAPPSVLATVDSPGPVLMIYDHYDVQPVDPLGLWDSPPFEPAERDGRVFARGAADNKGDLVARICALEAYLELAGDAGPGMTIKFVVEGEEESGSPHFDEICRAHAGSLKADHCVWEGAWFEHDGRPQVVYGCKGLLYIELSTRRLSSDQHSSQAVYAPSAAWDLLNALASMKDPAGGIAIEGFFDGIEPASPEELALADWVAFDEEAELQRLAIPHFPGHLSGSDLRRHLLYEPTANIAGFSTGYTVPGAAKTVLPAEALAKMDFRLVPGQDARDIAAKVRRHLDQHGFEHIEMVVLGAENPSRSLRHTQLGEAVEECAASWFRGELSVWPMMIATGPMSAIAQGLGIPICSPPGVTRPDSSIHAPNENVRIADFLDIVGYTISYLDRYAGMGAGGSPPARKGPQ